MSESKPCTAVGYDDKKLFPNYENNKKICNGYDEPKLCTVYRDPKTKQKICTWVGPSFICLSNRYENGKVSVHYNDDKIICDKQKNMKNCQEQTEDDRNPEHQGEKKGKSICVWCNKKQIGLCQAPWIKSITKLNYKPVELNTEKAMIEWKQHTRIVPRHWNQRAIARKIPKVISVKLVYCSVTMHTFLF